MQNFGEGATWKTKMTVFWDVEPCSLVDTDRRWAMMEAVSTSEASVNFYEPTRRIDSEDKHFHTSRRENLKSHSWKTLPSEMGRYIKIYLIELGYENLRWMKLAQDRAQCFGISGVQPSSVPLLVVLII
jgi:hypothetical protein